MKAAKGDGLVTSFFTYAGVWGEKSHHEIDFEVLGKDPTKVQINYYAEGEGKKGEHEKIINLGFDASKGYHNYGFKWAKDSITWYIDGKPVFTTRPGAKMPNKPCKIMVNFWPGVDTPDIIGWLKIFSAGWCWRTSKHSAASHSLHCRSRTQGNSWGRHNRFDWQCWSCRRLQWRSGDKKQQCL
jgi:beta-glucanase (GH16 family)